MNSIGEATSKLKLQSELDHSQKTNKYLKQFKREIYFELHIYINIVPETDQTHNYLINLTQQANRELEFYRTYPKLQLIPKYPDAELGLDTIAAKAHQQDKTVLQPKGFLRESFTLTSFTFKHKNPFNPIHSIYTLEICTNMYSVFPSHDFPFISSWICVNSNSWNDKKLL